MATTSYNVYQQITSVRLSSNSNLAGKYFNGALNNGVGATLTALTVGALVIDGTQAMVGDRILLFSQTNTNENGIYQVNATGGPISLWQIERSSDFQSVEQLKIGQYFSVGAGSELAGTMYVIVEPLPQVIGFPGNQINIVDVANSGSIIGPYLLKSANLSDVANTTTAFENLGLGRPGILILTDSDFSGAGGTYVLTNPPPIIISMSATSSGRILQLPPQNQFTSLESSQQIELLTGSGSQSIGINNGAGTLIFNVAGDSAWRAITNDRSTVQGAWEFLGEVQTINGNLTGNVIITSSLQSIYVSNSGSDVTGDGSIISPYATVSHALASITDASSSKVYSIEVTTGIYTETTLNLKPFVLINGNQSTLNVSGNIGLDATWTGGGFTGISDFYDITTTGMLLFFTNTTGNPASFFANNIGVLSGGNIWNLQKNLSGDSLNVNLNNINGQSLLVNLTNTTGNVGSSVLGELRFVGSVNSNCVAKDVLINGNFLSQSQSTGTALHSLYSSSVLGVATFQALSTGTCNTLSYATYYANTQVVDGSSCTLSIDSTNHIISPTGGAIVDYITIGNSIKTNFTPTVYTPVDPSVTGSLEGIDNYLGLHPQVVTSWNGSTSPVAVTHGTGIDITGGTIDAIVNTWNGSSTAVDVTAGAGIDITGGVISLTGAGPSASYGVISVQNLSTVISFTDTTTWKPLVGTILASGGVDFTVNNNTPSDPTTPFYLQYTGADTAFFQITGSFSMRRFTSTTANGYYISLSKDGINPISATFGEYQTDYGLSGQSVQNSESVCYTIEVQLSTNDKLYFLVQNGGPNTTTTDTDFLSTSVTVSVQKIGDVSGLSSGVASLNGLTGVVSITSNDQSISITPSGSTVDLSSGQYAPISGTSQAMAQNKGYLCLNVALTTLFLPMTCPAGAYIDIAGAGSGLFTISQGSGQNIVMGNRSTTTGVSGTFSSTDPNSSIRLVCTVANDSFMVVNSQGTFNLT